MRERVENTEMTFPIMKIINTELFIVRTAALYLGKIRVIVGTNDGTLGDRRIKFT